MSLCLSCSPKLLNGILRPVLSSFYAFPIYCSFPLHYLKQKDVEEGRVSKAETWEKHTNSIDCLFWKIKRYPSRDIPTTESKQPDRTPGTVLHFLMARSPSAFTQNLKLNNIELLLTKKISWKIDVAGVTLQTILLHNWIVFDLLNVLNHTVWKRAFYAVSTETATKGRHWREPNQLVI